MTSTSTVGLVGARGYAGRELLRIVQSHPHLALAYAASRSRAGVAVRDVVADWAGDDVFVDASPAAVADRAADVVVLALPNGESARYVEGLGADTIVVDLSADHRFDSEWAYGLAELHRGDLSGARRISNPGCYATAAVLALSPIVSLLDGPPAAFGVSGYSGAGTTPSPRNDEALLRDNVMPYRLTGHVHEREITHQLGCRVRFAPSVAPFERGLVVTVLADLSRPTDPESLRESYESHFRDDRLVSIRDEVPLPREVAGEVTAVIGGFSVDTGDRRRIGVAAALDNLLKGAASQAVQNINLACGLDELDGLEATGSTR